MHGFNEGRGKQSADKGYQIHSIWYTIQGEGPFAGLPAIFIRLTGCCYFCRWCDTTWDDEKDKYYSLVEIENEILKYWKCSLIVLTGGEPCRWDLAPLIKEFSEYNIQIETAGPYWQECFLDKNVTLVVSPKINKVHPNFLKYCDHWKYVVKVGDEDPNDGLPIEGTQRTKTEGKFIGGPMARPPKDRKVNIYLQPCDEEDKAKNLSNTSHMVKIALKYGYRAGLQLHKVFGVE